MSHLDFHCVCVCVYVRLLCVCTLCCNLSWLLALVVSVPFIFHGGRFLIAGQSAPAMALLS